MASNPEWHTCMRVAKALRILEAIGDVLVRNLYIHDTAEILSHQMATLVCVRSSTACSSAIQCMNIPISSRSDIEMLPFGFVDEDNSSRIDWGHSKYQTKGGRLFLPENHTPPTPHLEASMSPW